MISVQNLMDKSMKISDFIIKNFLELFLKSWFVKSVWIKRHYEFSTSETL